MSFSSVILAGGKSSRMGCDKAFLDVGGHSALAQQIQTVREAGATEVLISGRANTSYSAFDVPVIIDQFTDAGPLAGIHEALLAAQNPLVLVLAVDLPHLTSDFLQRLVDETGTELGVVPRCQGQIEPLAAFYPRLARSLCRTLLLQRHYAVRNFASVCVQAELAKFVDVPEQLRPCFANWNTPEDAGLKNLAPRT